MVQFNKIIAATDFSEHSFRAAEHARILATQFDAELLLVTVVDNVPATIPPTEGSPMGPTLDVEGHQKQLVENAHKLVDRMIADYSSADLRIGKFVLVGSPKQEIVRLAEEQEADLIVIATHGHGRFHRFVFGSVAEKVCRLAPCPVLTVPPPGKD